MNFRKIWPESMSIKCCFKQRAPCLNYTLTLHKIKQNLQLHLINTRTILVLVTLIDIRCYRMYINHNVPFFLFVYTKCYLFCANIRVFFETTKFWEEFLLLALMSHRFHRFTQIL